MDGMEHYNGNLTNARGKFLDVGGFALLGMGLWGVAFLAPDAGHRIGDFFTLAAQTSWLVPFQVQSAWCSLKIMLFSIGLFLLLDAAGSVLARWGRTYLAGLVFSLQIVNALIFLAGGFYFIKALV